MNSSLHHKDTYFEEQSFQDLVDLKAEDQKTIAIIQISRMGDVLQTILATKIFKSSFPNTNFIFIGRIQFAKPFEFILKETFNHIYYVNFPKHYWNLNDLTLDKLKSKLKLFLSSIEEHNIDSVVNLTFSKSSSYLATLISSKHKFGLIRNSSNNLLIGGKWSKFVYSNVMTGDFSPFNLVDVFKNILTETIEEQNSNNSHQLKTNNFFQSISNTNINQYKIIVHPFASHSKKFWKSSYWQQLIKMLLEDEHLSIYSFVVVGSLNDKKNYLEFNNFLDNYITNTFSNRLINKIGILDMQELSDEINTSSLFLGHDSMGGHLAAIHKVPTITISIGSVRAHETTPYGENNFNLVPKTTCFPCFPDTPCSNYICHLDVSPELIFYFVHALLSLENLESNEIKTLYSYFTQKIPSTYLKTSNIYQSYFSNNGMQTLSLVNTEIDFRTETLNIFKNFYNILWSFLFNDDDITSPIPEIKCKKIFNELKEYLIGLKYVSDVNSFGEKYSLLLLEEFEIATPNIAVIKEYSKKIQEIDKLALDLKFKYPMLSPLIDYYHVCKGNLKGNNIIQMATSSLLNFKEAKYSVNILKEFIEKTLDRSRKNFYSENNWIIRPEINSTRSES
ncbi:MAG: hypothetical protein HQK51_19975 [Oligoflexia bacterium]|nr:hypothetical protein [Oligoflexia bacterium]